MDEKMSDPPDGTVVSCKIKIVRKQPPQASCDDDVKKALSERLAKEKIELEKKEQEKKKTGDVELDPFFSDFLMKKMDIIEEERRRLAQNGGRKFRDSDGNEMAKDKDVCDPEEVEDSEGNNSVSSSVESSSVKKHKKSKKHKHKNKHKHKHKHKKEHKKKKESADKERDEGSRHESEKLSSHRQPDTSSSVSKSKRESSFPEEKSRQESKSSDDHRNVSVERRTVTRPVPVDVQDNPEVKPQTHGTKKTSKSDTKTASIVTDLKNSDCSNEKDSEKIAQFSSHMSATFEGEHTHSSGHAKISLDKGGSSKKNIRHSRKKSSRKSPPISIKSVAEQEFAEEESKALAKIQKIKQALVTRKHDAASSQTTPKVTHVVGFKKSKPVVSSIDKEKNAETTTPKLETKSKWDSEKLPIKESKVLSVVNSEEKPKEKANDEIIPLKSTQKEEKGIKRKIIEFEERNVKEQNGKLKIKIGGGVIDQDSKGSDISSVFEPKPMEPEGSKPKKQALNLKFGIKISDTSAAFISSGIKAEDKNKKEKEEGEVSNSDENMNANESSSDTAGTPDSSGSVTDSQNGEGEIVSRHKKRKKKERKKMKKHRDDKSHKRRRSHSNRSKTPKKSRHSRSRSRSASFDKRTGVWVARSKSRSRSRDRRSRSRSRGRRSRSREKRRKYRSRSRSRDRTHRRGRHGRRRSRSRSPSSCNDLRLKIDKAKLREIAVRNAFAKMQSGEGPKLELKPDQIATLRAGGKSVAELTDFCKKISEKEGDLSSDSSGGEHHKSDEDMEDSLIREAIRLRDSQSIVMNIRNARQLAIVTPAEKLAKSGTLRLQFPVSSGSQHRAKENEWTPVEKTTAQATKTTPTAPKTATPTAPLALPAPPPPPPAVTIAAPLPPPGVVTPVLASTANTTTATDAATAIGLAAKQPPPVIVVPQQPQTPAFPMPPAPVKPEDSVFPNAPSAPINISDVVSQRLSAMRKLQDNPCDVQALSSMYNVQKKMNQWAEHQHLPGQFTGSTGVQVLSRHQLSGGQNAWSRKDTLTRAAPVKRGIGAFLMEKMGWKEGEGLGKNSEGSKIPLQLDVKVDRKGLHSKVDAPKKTPTLPPTPVCKDLSGKHPVSALIELCSRRRWPTPDFTMLEETGPAHKRNFIIKVKVNGVEYMQSSSSTSKKQARLEAATACLQALGLVPR